ncbi:MAG: hypothetical protein H7258_06635 [Ferruginibacter sp.]|nr:hypothetical protein [Ferruginibacter sp.]
MGMEDDTRGFLVLIVNTISMVFIWLMLNVVAGIYFNLAFFEDKPRWGNYIYYLAFLTSLFYLIRYLRRKWKL